jgi:hypothetical protein
MATAILENVMFMSMFDDAGKFAVLIENHESPCARNWY